MYSQIALNQHCQFADTLFLKAAFASCHEHTQAHVCPNIGKDARISDMQLDKQASHRYNRHHSAHQHNRHRTPQHQANALLPSTYIQMISLFVLAPPRRQEELLPNQGSAEMARQ